MREGTVQTPPEYHGMPTFVRTTRRKIRINIGGEERSQEVVDIEDTEKNLLLFFMGSHAIKKLTYEMYVMYQLMWKHWGEIDRKTIFRLTGVSINEPSDRDQVNNSLARSLGSKLTDLICSVEFYLATWTNPSCKEITKMCHERLRFWVPKAYKVSSRLMSNGNLSKNKNFRDAVSAVAEACAAIYPLYDEQIQLSSTAKNHERRDWLNDMRLQAQLVRGSVNGIMGRNATTSLLFK